MTILEALKRANAVLIRSKNHQVWQLPNGRKFTMSQTPGDHRAQRNQLAVLRRLLALVENRWISRACTNTGTNATIESTAMPTR